ncbi:hypothetical protein HPB47_006242 [Ixodes persulcatus]|uniref:Uncharacterized protein n=1 Tax=Ixodes persulcatus TaxID=34615 RepID=A0AC60PAR3_IXOPE|nr:hypothetical protein HPB47_006242 [Ixodes persulcatus]
MRRIDREATFYCLPEGLEPLWYTEGRSGSEQPRSGGENAVGWLATPELMPGDCRAAPRFPSARSRGRPVDPEGLFRARAHVELGALPSAEGRVQLDGPPLPALGPRKKPAGIDPRNGFLRLPRGRHWRGCERGLSTAPGPISRLQRFERSNIGPLDSLWISRLGLSVESLSVT